MADPRVTFSDLRVLTRKGSRNVLVVEPSRDIVLDRDRLSALKAGDPYAGIDDEIIDAVDSRGDVHGLLLRARRADDSGRWRIAEELGDDEAAELAALMLRVHVVIFRRLARRGLFAFLSTDFSPRAVAAYERGSRKLIAELERRLVDATGVEASLIKLELWILERQAAWSARSFESFVEDRLPTVLLSAERQRKQLMRLLETIPEEI